MKTQTLQGRRNWPKWAVWTAVFLGIALLVAANAHLVYVSVTSQPECVSHLKPGHTEDGFRAARSSC